ncbi:hypothetical protein MPSEU_000414800 [Mayamaea pseudoterrestris]|nr:hypothetical protein MPSEU_000414800 [Mayamaea pseudoterrestris]
MIRQVIKQLNHGRRGCDAWRRQTHAFSSTAACTIDDAAAYDDESPPSSDRDKDTRRPRQQPRLEALRKQLEDDVLAGERISLRAPRGAPPRNIHVHQTTTPLTTTKTSNHQPFHSNNNTISNEQQLPPPPILITHSPESYQDWQAILAKLPHPPSRQHVLQDSYGRRHNYLRFSLTERCNFRCTYCMPIEGVALQPEEQLLTTTELLTLAKHFCSLGVNKIRLTGGEPTLNPHLLDIVTELKRMNVSVGITTNGFLLGQKPKLLEQLMAAGLDSMNVSLDSLEPEKFARITRRPASYLPKVLSVLDASRRNHDNSSNVSVKVNIVVMRGQNDDELVDFVKLGSEKNVVIRFIEYMPFTNNGWNTNTFMSYTEMMERTSDRLHWEQLPERDPHDTTKWYKATFRGDNNDTTLASASTTVGFITSMSHHFCAGCNRLRVSADGQIKVCLFDAGSHMVSLRNAMRAGLSEDDLHRIVYAAVQSKPWALGGHLDALDISKDAGNNRPMTLIGG